MKKSTLTKWVGKVGTLFAATVLAFTAQAAELFTATPSSVTVHVGETAAITLVTEYTSGDVTLRTGSERQSGRGDIPRV